MDAHLSTIKMLTELNAQLEASIAELDIRLHNADTVINVLKKSRRALKVKKKRLVANLSSSHSRLTYEAVSLQRLTMSRDKKLHGVLTK